jgi:hypothetical protein
MKAALARRILRIERHCSGPRRTRFIWQDAGEGEDVVEARKREMIASGVARRPIGSSRRAGMRRTRAGADTSAAGLPYRRAIPLSRPELVAEGIRRPPAIGEVE